jgi:hypothetical protein
MPMTQQELHSELDCLVSEWVAAACVWSNANLSLGDFRFVIFSTEVAPETEVFVQLWSEPLEPVSWEVSSGHWDPPAGKWLAGARSDRISAFGFEIGGRAENFQKEVLIQSQADVTSVALTIIDILYAGFDYRGTARLDARICYESRAKSRPVVVSCTPEDVGKVFVHDGHRLTDNNHDEDAPALQFTYRGIVTNVRFHDKIPDHHLFETSGLTCVLPARVYGAQSTHPTTSNNQAGSDDEAKKVEIGTTLHFSGGVTVEWLSKRIASWSAMIVTHQHEIRRHSRASRKRAKDTIQ